MVFPLLFVLIYASFLDPHTDRSQIYSLARSLAYLPLSLVMFCVTVVAAIQC